MLSLGPLLIFDLSDQQVLGLSAPERFPTLLPVSGFSDEGTTLVMATSAGGIKRTPLGAFSSIQRNGLAAIKLSEVRA
jgi:DNA gyrase subunit A